MFIGHFALGFAAKPAAPRASLGTLFLASQLADLLWPMLVLGGIERLAIAPGATTVSPLDFEYYPFSHSLLALAVWGLLFGVVYWRLTRSGWFASGVLSLLVVSHWVLDAIAHRPDLPWMPGTGGRVGLQLWNSVGATLAVEFALFAVGVALYARFTRPKDRVGSVALWALVVFLSITEIANVLGPAPPDTASVVWAAQSMWLLIAWGYWIDRHRLPRSSVAVAGEA